MCVQCAEESLLTFYLCLVLISVDCTTPLRFHRSLLLWTYRPFVFSGPEVSAHKDLIHHVKTWPEARGKWMSLGLCGKERRKDNGTRVLKENANFYLKQNYFQIRCRWHVAVISLFYMRCVTSVEDKIQILASGDICTLTSSAHQLKISFEIIESFGLFTSSHV